MIVWWFRKKTKHHQELHITNFRNAEALWWAPAWWESHEQRCYGLACLYTSVRATKINSNSFQDPQENRLWNLNSLQDREKVYQGTGEKGGSALVLGSQEATNVIYPGSILEVKAGALTTDRKAWKLMGTAQGIHASQPVNASECQKASKQEPLLCFSHVA